MEPLRGVWPSECQTLRTCRDAADNCQVPLQSPSTARAVHPAEPEKRFTVRFCTCDCRMPLTFSNLDDVAEPKVPSEASGGATSLGAPANPKGNARMTAGDHARFMKMNEIKARLEKQKGSSAPLQRAVGVPKPVDPPRATSPFASPPLAQMQRSGSQGKVVWNGPSPREPQGSEVQRPATSTSYGVAEKQTSASRAAARAAPSSTTTGRPPSASTDRRLSRAIMGQLSHERLSAVQRNDRHTLNRLRTAAGKAGFVRQQRIKAYEVVQRAARSGAAAAAAQAVGVEVISVATSTDMEEWSKNMLERDEQSLEHLAEADLAYLDMVRTKAGLHHQTAGACVHTTLATGCACSMSMQHDAEACDAHTRSVWPALSRLAP